MGCNKHIFFVVDISQASTGLFDLSFSLTRSCFWVSDIVSSSSPFISLGIPSFDSTAWKARMETIVTHQRIQ